MQRSAVRPPAVAGLFYPDSPATLRQEVLSFLAAAKPAPLAPLALIAPHAGYRYSGPIAGSAYACLKPHVGRFKRVVLLGPAHRQPVEGVATSSASAFATPLGDVPLDRPALDELLARAQIHISDEAHREEHGLEVHLPFLQVLAEEIRLVPLLVGRAEPAGVAAILRALLNEKTLLLISSDLSHYYDYATARHLDMRTREAIEGLELLPAGAACGREAINGLLLLAREQGWRAHTLDLRNSADTSGTRERVVGYGAFVFTGGASK